MSEIKCPKCGQVFTVNEDDYAAILNQVRTHEFEQELNSRVAAAKEADSKDAQLRLTQAVSEKEKEIAALNEQLNNLKESTALETNSKVAKSMICNTFTVTGAISSLCEKSSDFNTQKKPQKRIRSSISQKAGLSL